jgi:hypothetical protein
MPIDCSPTSSVDKQWPGPVRKSARLHSNSENKEERSACSLAALQLPTSFPAPLLTAQNVLGRIRCAQRGAIWNSPYHL